MTEDEELSCPGKPPGWGHSAVWAGDSSSPRPGGWALRTGGSADTGWGWAGAWQRRSAPCGSCTRTAGGTDKHSQGMRTAGRPRHSRGQAHAEAPTTPHWAPRGGNGRPVCAHAQTRLAAAGGWLVGDDLHLSQSLPCSLQDETSVPAVPKATMPATNMLELTACWALPPTTRTPSSCQRMRHQEGATLGL